MAKSTSILVIFALFALFAMGRGATVISQGNYPINIIEVQSDTQSTMPDGGDWSKCESDLSNTPRAYRMEGCERFTETYDDVLTREVCKIDNSKPFLTEIDFISSYNADKVTFMYNVFEKGPTPASGWIIKVIPLGEVSALEKTKEYRFQRSARVPTELEGKTVTAITILKTPEGTNEIVCAKVNFLVSSGQSGGDSSSDAGADSQGG